MASSILSLHKSQLDLPTSFVSQFGTVKFSVLIVAVGGVVSAIRGDRRERMMKVVLGACGAVKMRKRRVTRIKFHRRLCLHSLDVVFWMARGFGKEAAGDRTQSTAWFNSGDELVTSK